jgi:3',5'-cyclic AMP phosphodiesterase CpdA
MNFVKTGLNLPDFTLAHVSDFHVCLPESASASQFANKRILSYFSWRITRRRLHDPAVLGALAQAVRELAPDHVAVTGDLTQLGLPAEFDAARRFLEAMGSPRDVFVVPGNHDALVREGWEERFSRWADYMAPDGSAPPHPRVFPTLRVRGPVALIGLSTAHPTRPFSATGSIGADQLERCSGLLAAAGQRSLYRVVLIHHAPAAGMVSAHKRLSDADDFARLLQQQGAELILHGHTHQRLRTCLPGPQAPIPVIGASSASATQKDPLQCAGFGVVRISRTPTGWNSTFQEHRYAHERRGFIPGVQEPMNPQNPPHLVYETLKTYL